MIDKKVTRKAFIVSGLFGIMALIVAPISKMLYGKNRVSTKEAKYYKNLAG